MNDPVIAWDYSRRLLAGPSFSTFLPLAGVGNPEEPAWTYATKQADTKTDSGKMTISGSLTVEEPDRAKEILVLDGMDLQGFQRNPIGLFQHDRFKPIGRFVDEAGKFTVFRRGKSVEGTLHLVQKGPMAELATQVFGLVETKLLNGWSPGFMSHWKDYKRVQDSSGTPGAEGSGITRIEFWRPFEWSLVFVPENDRSLVTQVVRKGLSMGSGFKPLLPPLMQHLAPYAEISPEWVPGADLATAKTAEQIAAEAAEKDAQIQREKALSTQTQVQQEVREVIKEVIPERVKQLADAGEWYEKFIGTDLALPIHNYSGKPGQKALRATHDAAMFTSLMILKTLEEIDGPAEKSLADSALAQQKAAMECVEQYKMLYGNGQGDMEKYPEWASVTAAELYEITKGKSDASEIAKELQERAKEWVVRTKGWGKHHAMRCKSAAECLDMAAKNDSLKPEERAKCMESAKSLREMVDERGNLTDLADAREKELEDVLAMVKELDEKNKQLDIQLKRAKFGARV